MNTTNDWVCSPHWILSAKQWWAAIGLSTAGATGWRTCEELWLTLISGEKPPTYRSCDSCRVISSAGDSASRARKVTSSACLQCWEDNGSIVHDKCWLALGWVYRNWNCSGWWWISLYMRDLWILLPLVTLQAPPCNHKNGLLPCRGRATRNCYGGELESQQCWDTNYLLIQHTSLQWIIIVVEST